MTMRELIRGSLKETLVNSSFRAERSGDPESSGLYSMRYGLFAALTPGAVRVHLHRARLKLRARLTHHFRGRDAAPSADEAQP